MNMSSGRIVREQLTAAFALLVLLPVLGMMETVGAEDFGNWARNTNGSSFSNCPTYYACFWSP